MSNDIKVFSLTTGESVIAEVKGESSDTYTISNPYSVAIGPSGPAIMPFCPIAETEEVTIYKKFMMTEPMEPKRAVLDAYRDVTGKIMLVEASPLIH